MHILKTVSLHTFSEVLARKLECHFGFFFFKTSTLSWLASIHLVLTLHQLCFFPLFKT